MGRSKSKKKNSQRRAEAEEKWRLERNIRKTRVFPDWFLRIYGKCGWSSPEEIRPEAYHEDLSEIENLEDSGEEELDDDIFEQPENTETH